MIFKTLIIMKLNSIFYFAALLCLASCTLDEMEPVAIQSEEGYSLQATIESEVETKAGVMDKGTFYWTKGDEVAVFSSPKTPSSLSLTSGAYNIKAVFTLTRTDISSVMDLAVYPASIAKEYSDGVLTVNLPKEYELNDYSEVAATPMASKIAEDNSVKFKHICGLLRITLNDAPENVVKMTLSSKSRLTGDFSSSESDSYIIKTSETEVTDSVIVNLGSFNNYRDIVANIPVPTGTYENFTIRLLDATGNTVWKRASSKSRTVNAADIYVFSPMTVSHRAVDLGLPSGTLWATTNIGADSPKDYGSHFMWGETEPKEYSDKNDYKFADYSKYNSTDNLSELELCDDAAYVNWGSDWRIPSKTDFEELYDNCTITRGSNKDMVFSGKNGDSIKLPLAGYYYSGYSSSYRGVYWTRDKYPSGPYTFQFTSYGNTGEVDFSPRYYSASIRPVKASSENYFSLTENLNVESGKTASIYSNLSGLSWSSDNRDVATVDSDGVVTGISTGTAVITASNGTQSKSCKVYVHSAPNISASYTGGSIWQVNDYLRSGSVLNFSVSNKGDNIVELKEVKMVDASDESVSATTYSAGWTFYAGDRKGCSLTLKKSMITPKAIFIFTCNGAEYECSATYVKFSF
jgi:uncharacterized protein YjdB